MFANALFLFAEAAIYFVVMAGLFHTRKRHGIGLFMCALGVMARRSPPRRV